MYFMKRALKYIKNKKGKTLLLGIIFLIIANFVLAGLLVYNATVKAQEQTRESIGAEVKYIIDNEKIIGDSSKGVLNKEDSSILKASFMGGIVTSEKLTEKGGPTYTNIMKVVDSEYVDSYDISISFEADSQQLEAYTQDTGGANTSNHIFDIKLFSAVEPTDFSNGNAELVEGEFPSIDKINSGENVVLVEETVASNNNLKIGDTITTTVSVLDYEDVELELKIVGIYKTNEEVEQRLIGRGGASLLPQNRLYVPFNILKSIGLSDEELDNLLITSNVINLKDPLYTDDYKLEAENKIKFNYGKLDANDALYNSLMGPIEKLGVIAKIMVIIIAVAGAAIIGLITALTVNERKEEIGIMLAVGESKIKIVVQFVIEVTIIAIIAFLLSSFTGSVIGEEISSAVLESDIINDSSNDKGFMMKPVGQISVVSGKSSKIKDNQFNISVDNKQKNDKLSLEDNKVDINFDITALIQLFGLGLLMSIISTIIPSLYVMRFNPKQILINRT